MIDQKILNLYSKPLPSSRSGAIYNVFSYPTKISPEAIAIYIATHTEPGDKILDPFAGSGTTGLATLLCDQPNSKMKKLAKKLNMNPQWGQREAVLYEIGVLGSFISDTLTHPPNASFFEEEARKFIADAKEEIGHLYETKDPDGEIGKLRYIIWSDILRCPACNNETSFWKTCVTESPTNISSDFICPTCGLKDDADSIPRPLESYFDPITKKKQEKKKRRPVKIYGRTGNSYWSRYVNEEDLETIEALKEIEFPSEVPCQKVNWGDLHRKGYHKGIDYIHQFYTLRNLYVFSYLWNKTKNLPTEIKDQIRLLLLSYNSSHSTLMSRVVVKGGQSDFALTGAQPGVLYISSLPVEKNILDGVNRKITTFSKAFAEIESSNSKVSVVNKSSTNIELEDRSIDYVFTDPPFGDYIPYAELSQINEAWLGDLTNQSEEVIISSSQNKGVDEYRNLMSEVFSEISRVLKDTSLITVVFHSAKASVWRAIMKAFQNANLKIQTTSFLDKLQRSFKQVNSKVSVKGDPLLLLSKDKSISSGVVSLKDEEDIVKSILKESEKSNGSFNKSEKERIYSKYLRECLESGVKINHDAKSFFKYLEVGQVGG